MANYSIKDIEHLSGIKAHTLRIWEKRYNILEPKRTPTNIRYYDDEDLKKILNISVLNRHGYKISKIASFPNDRLGNEILSITQSSGEIDGQIEKMIVAMIDFDEFTFDKIFNKAVINLGFEDTMMKVIYPFFEKIGILWQTGNIDPAQEHFISNLIRQKLIVSIDNLMINHNPSALTFVLFLPDGEWHELGLLFYTYFIKKFGHRVIYLGSSLPVQSALDMKNQIRFDAMVTSFKLTMSLPEYKKYIKQLATLKSKTIYLLGVNTHDFSLDLPSNIVIPKNLEHFKNHLEGLN